MLRWTPVAVVVVALLFIAGALSWSLYGEYATAPFGERGAGARHHYHFLQVTRIPGNAEEVRAAVERAALLDAASPALVLAPGEDWRVEVQRLIHPSARPTHIVALPEDSPAWALPGAYWAIYAGAPVVFVGRDALTEEAKGMLRDRHLPIFLLAPEEEVSEGVLRAMRRYGPVRRIAAASLADHAVLLARYRDAESGFGWGRQPGGRNGDYQFVLAAPADTATAIAALPLAPVDSAPLLFVADDGSIPAATLEYLAGLGLGHGGGASPRHRVWLLGNRSGYVAEASLQSALAGAPRRVREGQREAFIAGVVIPGLGGALFVLLHLRRTRPASSWVRCTAWVSTALWVPLLGVLLYLTSSRNRVAGERPLRPAPPLMRGLSACVVDFGFIVPPLVAVGYLAGVAGLPLPPEWIDALPLFPGAGFTLSAAVMYGVALVVTWLLVRLPLATLRRRANPARVAWPALWSAGRAVCGVGIGIAAAAWGTVGAGEGGEMEWLSTLWLGSAAGFFVTWFFHGMRHRLAARREAP